MSTRIRLAGAGLIALILAFLTARVVQGRVSAAVVRTRLPVAKRDIPAYTLITEDMLAEAEFPRQTAAADVARSATDLVGKVARTDIPAGAPVFLAYVQDLSEFHLSDRAKTALVPLDLGSSVTLGVAPGRKVDVWRVALGRPTAAGSASAALLEPAAAAELVAHDLPVLAVYGPRGGRAAAGSAAEGRSLLSPARPVGGEGTLRGVLVEADPITAAKLVRLMGEVQTGLYRMYLTLSPVVRDEATLQAMMRAANPTRPTPRAAAASAPGPLPARAVRGTPPSSTPAPAAGAATPTLRAAARVLPGPASGLNVRSGPGTEFPVLVQVRAGTRLSVLGRTEDASWLYVAVGNVHGWVAAPYVSVEGDVLNLPPVRP